MLLPAKQLMNYFHVFISAICLAVVHMIASHQELWSAPSFWFIRYHLSGHVSCVPQQLNSKLSGESCEQCVESLLGSPMLSLQQLSPMHLFNQTGSYYIITNFCLIWDRSQLYPVSQMISLLLHSTLAPPWSCVISTISSL